MTTSTSSARYTDLYDYTRTAEQIDYELMGQADRLINRLSHFEATCRERGFQVSSDGLGSALRSYGAHALPIDQQVRRVGEAFQRADGAWLITAPVIRPTPSPNRLPSSRSVLSLVGLLGVADWLVDTTIGLDKPLGWAETAIPALAGLFIKLNPSRVAGNFGVSAPAFSRWVWGLNARYAKLSTVTNTMFGFRHALANVSILSAIAIIPASARQIKANAQQYALDPLRMAVANLIDLEFIAASSIIGAAGGAKIGSVLLGAAGGAVGSVIPVVGTAAGAAAGAFIGGVVGGAVGGWLAGKTQDAFIKSETHDKIIDGISQKGYQAIDFLGTKQRELSQVLDRKALELADFTDKTVDGLGNILSSKADDLGDYLRFEADKFLKGSDSAPAF